MKKKVVTIKTDIKDAINKYLTFTKPLNKLRPKEIDLLSEMTYLFIKEKDNFKREEDLWKKVFDYDSKIIYKENLNIEDYTLQSLLSSLRKKKVIENNTIRSVYIPDLSDNEFLLVFKFILNEE
jgi:hypothetical protein